jgi:hypothetical protein
MVLLIENKFLGFGSVYEIKTGMTDVFMCGENLGAVFGNLGMVFFILGIDLDNLGIGLDSLGIVGKGLGSCTDF